MKIDKINWLIGGAAGQGALQASNTLALSLTRGGLYTHVTSEFPSLIRGGHNYTTIRISENPVLTHSNDLNMVLALNRETIDLHINEVTKNGIVIFDSDEINLSDIKTPKDITLFPVPLKTLALKHGKHEITKNIVGLGVTLGLLKFNIKFLLNVLEDTFKNKGSEIIENNRAAAEAGYNFAIKNYPKNFKYELESKNTKGKRLFLNGNDALCIGAIRAGCKFVAEYPMTPSTSILHTMASEARNFNVVVKHTEDEIAAVNMLVGAGFSGARALTGTSGGGFSLMSEGLGLSISAEIPMVIVNSQRGGPSTGLPTRTDQGDLNLVYYTTQGDAPRFVIAPGDHEESFSLGFQAFNIAEKYQSPVIIITDKYLSESGKTVERFEHKKFKIDRGKLVDSHQSPVNFKRYQITEDGVSPRSIPGQEGFIYRASGYEQDEYGRVSEDPKNHTDMTDKRARKLETALKELPAPPIYGPKNAAISIISWGSTKGAILEAIEILGKEGLKVNFMQIQFIQPLHKEKIKKFMQNAFMSLIIEGNQSGQLSQIIKHETMQAPNYEILKYDSRPITQIEIINAIKEIMLGEKMPKGNVRIKEVASFQSQITGKKSPVFKKSILLAKNR